jgi:uncharacterized protein
MVVYHVNHIDFERTLMLDLLDYRRTVSELYAKVRQHNANATIYPTWREERDTLFAKHSQSALDDEQKAKFTGLLYYDYDPAYDVVGDFNPDVEPKEYHVDVGDDGEIHYKRVGEVTFTIPTGTGTLSVFWMMGYGGGIFIPFGDATNKITTYGAGRYLYDTIKGADLGMREGLMVMNFNYAYNPSCSYNYRWVCPLAPPESKVDFEIPVGEKVLEI